MCVGATSGINPAALYSQPPGTQPAGGDLTPQDIMIKYHDEIEAASKETGIPKEILTGMIWQESKGKANTPGGGLLQLGPNEFGKYGHGGDINNPRDNITAAARYMQDLHEQFGSWEVALRAYNSGPKGVDVKNLAATPAGTGDPTYIQKVMQAAMEAAYDRGSASMVTPSSVPAMQ